MTVKASAGHATEGASLDGGRLGYPQRPSGALSQAEDPATEFVVIWSGALERAGLCPGLSSHTRGPLIGEHDDEGVGASRL
ncbi:MAG: hypothetical protein ABI603_01735 [Acidobacteriota bacterium]